MSTAMIGLFLNAFWQTILMVSFACAGAVLLGVPLGVILLITADNHLLPHPKLNKILGIITNGLRSIPFIILMVAIIPLTRLIVGTSIGTAAATVPLLIAATPFMARIVESALQQVPGGLIEAAQSMGATPFQIIYKVLLPESMPSLVRGITLTLIALIGYSAMAGVIGGGGLGDLAVRYGYQRFNVAVMLWTIVILILLVQFLQMVGDRIARWLTH
ncbi:MAG: ABC transporter permease [Proteobacteria bacterium]|nr:ABC transporter permease [Pseudomonadota bacterium]